MPLSPLPRRAALLALISAAVACIACSRVSSPDAASESPSTRLVPASATAVDFVQALVESQRVVGIPSQALEYSTLHDDPEAWRAVPRFEAYLAEPVLALEPDLVLADPWQAPETTQRLREFGVRVVLLPAVSSWSEARAALATLGRELDVQVRAQELIAALDRRVEHLRERAGHRPALRALCYSNFGGAGSTAGLGTTLDSMFALVGLGNLIAERGARGHVGVSFEELLSLDPDVIVTSRPLKMAEGPSGDRGGASAKLLYSEPSLANLRAVRERRILELPAWLFATGSHEIVRGAEELDAQLDALLARLGGATR